MFKKIAIAAPLVVMALTCSFAQAAEENITIQLKADIPAVDFHVRPPAGEDFSKVQEIKWENGRLNAWENNLDALHSSQAIHAKLDFAPELISGTDRIPLKVNVNGKEVLTTSAQVVNPTEAAAGKRVAFTIVPQVTGARPNAGIYTGTVALIFEPGV